MPFFRIELWIPSQKKISDLQEGILAPSAAVPYLFSIDDRFLYGLILPPPG